MSMYHIRHETMAAANTTKIVTIATGAEAAKDVQTLLFTLQQWQKTTTELFVFTDSQTKPSLVFANTGTHVRTHVHVTMDEFQGLTRKDMEARQGRRYATLFHDYTAQKITAMDEVFDAESGVWFLDADICLFAALPNIPSSTTVALSPHYIRAGDEVKFGRYNAGFLWIKDRATLDVWRKAMFGSRFFEQAALEAVATAAAACGGLYEFPIQNNFGWWRLFQSADPPAVIESRLAFHRIGGDSVGLRYDGETLRSIHTHMHDTGATGHMAQFNKWIKARLEFLARSHKPARALMGHLQKMGTATS
jgi:hypothetical protein